MPKIVISEKFPWLGVALVFWVFIRSDVKPRGLFDKVVNHERIHIRQQWELGVIMFFYMYGISYVINLFKYKGNHNEAYKQIWFEKEAYPYDHNLYYLNKRNFCAWVKYI